MPFEQRNLPLKFGILANAPNCAAAVLPLQHVDGTVEEWDTSRYVPIAQVGGMIIHHCVDAMGLPGIGGFGGVEPIGKTP